MTHRISAPVGAGGSNRFADVAIVQRLLAQHGTNPGRPDGLCGARTVRAILDFQAQFLNHPDGRIDPDGATWRQLTARHHSKDAAHTLVHAAAPKRPLAARHGTTSGHPNQTLTTLVPRPSRDAINNGLAAVSPEFMIAQLGSPRSSYSADCQEVTNEELRREMTTESIGRIRVTGLRPAVASLREALGQVAREQAAVYGMLGTAGMLCCRLVRGSGTAISNHSWGTAIDFTLNGVLDRRGDNRVQVGLTLIASIMNQHGWYWGAAFRTEDAMHFEAGRTLITQWATQIRGGKPT